MSRKSLAYWAEAKERQARYVLQQMLHPDRMLDILLLLYEALGSDSGWQSAVLVKGGAASLLYMSQQTVFHQEVLPRSLSRCAVAADLDFSTPLPARAVIAKSSMAHGWLADLAFGILDQAPSVVQVLQQPNAHAQMQG